MRRTAALAALGLAAYAVFLLFTVPAPYIAARVLDITKGAVMLTGAKGTLWHGDARARVFPRRGPPVEIDALAWRFQPARLLAGRLSFDVKLAAAGLQGELEAARAPGGWQARDLVVRGDAAGLASVAPILAALRPTGAITLAAPRLDWDGEALRGDAMAEWRGAAVGWSEVRPLGSYRANLRATQGPAQVSVVTLDGPLRMTGQGTLTPPMGLTFSGEARADAAQAQALEPLMALMGPKRADGAHAIEWR
jgi:general secretion pathway protein N